MKHLGTVVRGTGTFAISPVSTNHAAGMSAGSDAAVSTDRAPETSAGSDAGASADRAAGTSAGSDAAVSTDRAPETSAGGDAAVSADRAAGTSGGASVFTWSEDVVPPLGRVGVAVWPVVRPVFEVLMRVSLRRLVREVER
ncbi:hypothetical protein AB0H36_17160 [Kribbella sp. NPDC050820]|uniref:hypothetical protein n=1 Tax=Kribbella sp. NPDC050820 TaxID=3155408 RepID=UPI0033F3E704